MLKSCIVKIIQLLFIVWKLYFNTPNIGQSHHSYLCASYLSLQSYNSILRRSNRQRKAPGNRARLSPLVLLLDGALVGELETVQRAVQEVYILTSLPVYSSLKLLCCCYYYVRMPKILNQGNQDSKMISHVTFKKDLAKTATSTAFITLQDRT